VFFPYLRLFYSESLRMWSYIFTYRPVYNCSKSKGMGPLRFELRFRRDPRTIKYVPNAEGWSRLPYGPLLIWCQCIYKFHVGQEYSTATVTCDPQVIHDLGRIFAVLCSPFVFIPAACDYFSTTETTDWYHLYMPYLYDF
jgi:hypothetical protein